MRVLDLTMSISPEIKVFPGSPQPFFIPWSTLQAHGYDSEVMFMSTHTGTHMDAPSHFARGRKAIDAIPAPRLVRNAILARVYKKAGQTITVADIEEGGGGKEIHPGDAVVLATGWEKHYDARDYMTANPGLSKAAARYLVRKKVSLVGIDGPSIDCGRDSKFSAHNTLLPAGVLVVENLCNLDRIKKKRITLIVAPLKIAGATGSPVRAIALF